MEHSILEHTEIKGAFFQIDNTMLQMKWFRTKCLFTSHQISISLHILSSQHFHIAINQYSKERKVKTISQL